jgi:hypothetical protein
MSMRQIIKCFLCVVLLTAAAPAARAFSLVGPAAAGSDAWEAQANGFNPLVYGIPFGITTGSTTTPKNLAEEYRCNAPVMYYACDTTFLEYFGMAGMDAIHKAYDVLNNLTNVDAYSKDLTEFPLQSEAMNYTAQTWGVYDLKSVTLSLMMRQIGLDDAIRYTWVIHDRYQPPGSSCPNGTVYLVTMRNFDMLSPMPGGSPAPYSPYVNGVLYTYRIWEYCGANPPSPLTAAAVAVNLDPMEEFLNAPVASGTGIASAGVVSGAYGFLLPGGYYTGLTRDDVQGLRYLYTTNNINYDPSAQGSVLLSSSSIGGTNYGAPYILWSSNYTALAQAAYTNDPVTLANMFPGLLINSYTNWFSVISTPNVIAYFTNNVGEPVGIGSLLVIATNGYTYSIVTNYAYDFANVIILTNGFRTNTSARVVTVQVVPNQALGNGVVTNTTSRKVTLTNGVYDTVWPSGEYYILTNSCGLVIASTLLTNVTATTNNILSAFSSIGLSYSKSLVVYATNHAFVAVPIICATAVTGATANVVGLYQGLGELQFVQGNYDSLIGQYFQPITNTYAAVFVTNNQAIRQTFQRIVTTPDITFSAADLTSGPGAVPVVSYVGMSDPPFTMDSAAVYGGQAGPGVINPSGVNITYNKVGPVYYNLSPSYLNGTNYPFGSRYFLYGSFDGTTNTPIVYPDAGSLARLEAAELIQVTPGFSGGLASGRNGTAYSASISALGGTPPCTWSLAVGQLPDGLSLSTASATNCVISGTPTRVGTYYFTIQMTDSSAAVNTLNLDYSITINY